MKNPRTGVYHDYCSITCMHQHKYKQTDGMKNFVVIVVWTSFVVVGKWDLGVGIYFDETSCM